MSLGHTILVLRVRPDRNETAVLIYDVFHADDDRTDPLARLGVLTIDSERRDGRFEVITQGAEALFESVRECDPVYDSRGRMEIRRTLLAIRAALDRGEFPDEIFS
jgi:hypothetical protein